MDIKVSVVLPTFNRAPTLPRAIRSVLCQTHSNLELIVVDDGSSDRTPEVIRTFDDDRLRYLRQEKNRGAHTARNLGIEAATGTFVAFQDSDDLWLPAKLEAHLASLAKCPNSRVSVVAGMRILPGQRQKRIPKRSRRISEGCHQVMTQLLAGSFIGTPLLMAERELLNDVGMFDEHRTHLMEDWDLALRLSKRTPFAFCNQVLHIAFSGDDNLVHASPAMLAEAIASVVTTHFDRYSKHKTELAMQYLLIGRHYLQAGDKTRARYYLAQMAELGSGFPIHLVAAIFRLTARAVIDLIPESRLSDHQLGLVGNTRET